MPGVGSADRLAAVLARLAVRHRAPGAQVAVWSAGETVMVQTGAESRGRPMREDSRVPIGSVTKAATATLAMMLVSDGDLELDQPVGEILGDPGLSCALTLRRLLSHTSGLPSDPADAAGTARKEVRSAEFVCEPGTAFSYSNLGYALVGLLIEEVTGMDWREAVESILLRPLEIEPVYVDSPGIATGHARDGERPLDQVLPPMLDPAGALALSARDLVALGRVHLGKPGLLDVVTASDLHRPVPGAEPFGLADGWGLGLACFGEEEFRWLGHDGTADGTSCHLRIDQAGACVLALTANGAGGTDLWHDLVDELPGLGLPSQRAQVAESCPIPFPDGDFGNYRNGAIGYTIRSDARGDACLDVDGDVFPELTRYADGTFTVRDPATGRATPCGRFRGEPGAATAVEIGGRLARRC
ncbi:serine hydrolase domain-containing protein [Amycolatopsis circi]|uniref:serine hydrolase domain-containing protein n=1 Tax=Amycolatopsis circi TaxID=871959 RepID=UPI001FCA479B|nr:serine hydrolase domain-containing protein [Amycolatopsis circi]